MSSATFAEVAAAAARPDGASGPVRHLPAPMMREAFAVQMLARQVWRGSRGRHAT
jgi:hypothetical protein